MPGQRDAGVDAGGTGGRERPPGLRGSADGPGYADGVLSTPGLRGYWRLGETSGTAAADATGGASGTYVGGVGLGARGALSSGADTSVRFDGVDDEMRTGDAVVAGAATLEGWFFWEGGVAVMRDATSSGGWILAFDSGGRVAYRVGGTTVTTALAAADLRDGWHHLAVTASSGASAFYVDGVPVHNGAGAGHGGGRDAVADHAQRHDEPVHARACGRGRGLRRRARGGHDPRALRERARYDRHRGARGARRA